MEQKRFSPSENQEPVARYSGAGEYRDVAMPSAALEDVTTELIIIMY